MKSFNLMARSYDLILFRISKYYLKPIFPQNINILSTLFVNVYTATVHSKVVVLLLLNHCLLFFPLFVGVPYFAIVLLFSTLYPSRFATVLMRELIDLLKLSS